MLHLHCLQSYQNGDLSRMSVTDVQGICLQDLEGVCREAGKQAHDWAASVRSREELADQTGYELSSGHNRSLVAIIAEKRERKRCSSTCTPIVVAVETAVCTVRSPAYGRTHNAAVEEI